MVRATAANGEAERHGLQRPRLIAGKLQALDVRRKVGRSAANSSSRAAAALGEQVAQTFAMRDLFEKNKHFLGRAETQVRFVKEPLFRTFHGKRNRGACRDRVESELIAFARGFENGLLVADAAQRPQRK